MKGSEEEGNEYKEEEKQYDNEDEEVDPSKTAVAADMARRNVDLDDLVRMRLKSMERKGEEEGLEEGEGG